MSVFHTTLFRQQALIAGVWRDAADGTTLAVSSFARTETTGRSVPHFRRSYRTELCKKLRIRR